MRAWIGECCKYEYTVEKRFVEVRFFYCCMVFFLFLFALFRAMRLEDVRSRVTDTGDLYSTLFFLFFFAAYRMYERRSDVRDYGDDSCRSSSSSSN